MLTHVVTLKAILILHLRQKKAREHLLARVLVIVRLEVQHGLRLVFRQPERLQVQVGQCEGQMGQSVAAHVQHMQLFTRADLVRDAAQLILAQGKYTEVDQLADLRRQLLQTVAVHVEVGHSRQVTNRAGH